MTTTIDLPFLKPKRVEVPNPVIPRGHPLQRGQTPVCSRFPKMAPIIDITRHWKAPVVKNDGCAEAYFLDRRIAEYKDAFPEASNPSSNDLIVWLYNRARTAEQALKILEQEISILESGRHGI